jgi:hypothetical protein
MFAAISSLSATFSLPHWLNEVTFHVAGKDGYGADFSVFMGMGVGGLLYLVLAWRGVRAQAAEQDRRLADAGPV